MPPHSIYKEPSPTEGEDSPSNHTRRRVRPKYNVNITSNVEFRGIERIEDIAEEDKLLVWYSSKEIQRSIDECKATVIAMQSGMPLMDDDGDQVTSRGLEYMTADGFDITSSSLDSVKIVLEEQQRQKSEGIFPDMELLACSVEGISKHRLRVAHLAGMKDARGVYGEGNFKCDSRLGERSKSFTGRRESRRERGVNRTSSSGAIIERTRRRRGSRGPLKDRPSRHRSSIEGASADAVGTVESASAVVN